MKVASAGSFRPFIGCIMARGRGSRPLKIRVTCSDLPGCGDFTGSRLHCTAGVDKPVVVQLKIRSSVVSVLISLISDMLGLLRPGHGLSRYCTTSEYGPLPPFGGNYLCSKLKNWHLLIASNSISLVLFRSSINCQDRKGTAKYCNLTDGTLKAKSLHFICIHSYTPIFVYIIFS